MNQQASTEIMWSTSSSVGRSDEGIHGKERLCEKAAMSVLRQQTDLEFGSSSFVSLQQLSVSSAAQSLQRLLSPGEAVHDPHTTRRLCRKFGLWDVTAAEVGGRQGKLQKDGSWEETKGKVRDEMMLV